MQVLLCIVLGLGVATAGCSPTIDLSRPSPQAPPRAAIGDGVPVISTVTVVDARTDQFPEVVAVVADQYGNPRATVGTRRPLAEEMADRIRDALRQRNLSAPPGADTLLVRIVRLEAKQRDRAEAVVALTYRLVDPAGTERFVGTADVVQAGAATVEQEAFVGYIGRYAYPGILGYPGPLASTEAVRAVMQAALTKAVDQVLDHPDFRAALQRGPGSR